MALTFPSSPTANQLFPAVAIAGVPQWRYDGNKWQIAKDTGPEDGQLYGMRDGQWVLVPIPEPVTDVSMLPLGGQLRRISLNEIGYFPFNGGWIRINGKDYPLPATGIIANHNSCFINGTLGTLAASTFYRVYLFDNGGVPAIDFSTTDHVTSSTSGNVGIEIKQGDDTRTLIGIIHTDAGGQFRDEWRFRYVRSWLNRRLTGLGYTEAFSNWGATDFTPTNVSIWMICFPNETMLLSFGGFWYSNIGTASFFHITYYHDGLLQGGGYSMHCNNFFINASSVTRGINLGHEGLHSLQLSLHTFHTAGSEPLLTGHGTITGLY